MNKNKCSMLYPSLTQHTFYSLNLYEGLEILIDDLERVNSKMIQQSSDRIEVIPKALTIDLKDKTIHLFGYKLKSNKYLATSEGKSDIFFISYSCPNSQILQGLEYLVHMKGNLLPENSFFA